MMPAARLTRARVTPYLEQTALFLAAVNAMAGVTFAILAPDFGTVRNLLTVFSSALPLLLLATGQTFVLITGGIDLSAPAIVGLASVCGALIMSADTSAMAASPAATPIGIAVMLAIGAAAGSVNGLCVATLRTPAFMATFIMSTFASGLAVWLARAVAGTDTTYHLPPAFLAIGRVAGLDAAVAIGATIVAAVVLSRTLAGRWLQAVGHSARTAHVSGVPGIRIVTLAYTLSGVFAGLAAVLLTARLETGSATHGRQLLLDVIGAAVIGGTSLSGGTGNIVWTALGVLFLSILGNGLTMLNLSDFVITMIKGVVILAAALLDGWRRPWVAGRP